MTFAGSRAADPSSIASVCRDRDDTPGTVLEAAATTLRVATGDGVLELLEIQAEGKRPMPAREFLAGHPLAPGTHPPPVRMIARARSRRLRHPAGGLSRTHRSAVGARARARDRSTTSATARWPAKSRPGVLRHRAALDHLIATFAKRAASTRLDPEVVTILRLSAYQLLHLTRVPASAVVDDAVDLARRAKKRSASGFVNAVLRSVSAEPPRPAVAAAAGRPADREAALELSLDDAVASAMAGGPVVSTASASSAPSMDAVQQPAAEADAARQPAEDHDRRR